jgi:flagellin FlaB
MLKGLNKSLRRDERGITGLETAIILIAFVVVASVFAYTVLSAGIFSSQKGQEAVYTGLQTARSTLALKGDVVGNATSGDITGLVICVTNALNGEAIDLTGPIAGTGSDIGKAGNDSPNVVVVSYSDSTQRVDDLYWTAEQLGTGNGDHMLDPGETFQMTIDLEAVGGIGTYKTFDIDIKPPVGSVLTIERTTPAALPPWLILN